MKSRVKGDFQARFRENVRVKFPCVTRLNLPNNHFFKYYFVIWNKVVFLPTNLLNR